MYLFIMEFVLPTCSMERKFLIIFRVTIIGMEGGQAPDEKYFLFMPYLL